MTLCECAKFLIRLARQPEAAAAPQSLHGLSALQHNKPLYSFEDNADYVYDVMWSPVHPALFACVDGMGRLDLWNLNNDTEVSAGAGPGGLGGGRRRLLSVSPSLWNGLFWTDPLIAAVLPTPHSPLLCRELADAFGPKSFNLTSSLKPWQNPGQLTTLLCKEQNHTCSRLSLRERTLGHIWEWCWNNSMGKHLEK